MSFHKLFELRNTYSILYFLQLCENSTFQPFLSKPSTVGINAFNRFLNASVLNRLLNCFNHLSLGKVFSISDAAYSSFNFI